MSKQELLSKSHFKDQDQELFFKYNYQYTKGRIKDDQLTEQLYNNEIVFTNDKEYDKFLILLHGSYACNLKCIYCENQHLRSEYIGATISKDTIRMILEKLGTHIREITWHGGEPLLLPEELIIFLEDEKKRLGLNFTTSMQTNSVLLSPSKLDFLDNLGIVYGFSFDGLYNDITRGTVSTNAALDYLERRRGRVGFISVANYQTIDRLIENYEYYKTLGVPKFRSNLVRENVIENDNPYLIPNHIAIDEMMKYLEYWIHDTHSPIIDGSLVRLIKKVLAHPEACEDSYCLNGWLTIDPFGNIVLCRQCALDHKICNIRDISNYDDLYYHPQYRTQLCRQKKLLESCKKTCKWYHSCHGGCMGLNYDYKPDFSEPNPRMCEYNALISERVYELIKDIDVNDVETYNPLFLKVLADNNYYSLTEIKEIEKRHSPTGELNSNVNSSFPYLTSIL